MSTRFRTMLAPIGLSTGDGRRFKDGAIELVPTPFPFEWVRVREGGHNGAVGVGVVQETFIGTVKEAVANDWISADKVKGMDPKLSAVWARGDMFDGVSREDLPRLAEDVAEAMHLAGQGTLGPSVDLDSFEGVPVLEGADTPLTWEDMERIYEETGEEPKIELLVTSGRVRAATLVSIPAFAETSRPLELVAADSEDEPADALALVASVAVTDPRMRRAALFDMPALDGPTPITWDWDNSIVYGHIATWQTCHVGYADVCVTAPKDEAGGYAWFNRFPVETEDGTVWAGRITVGGRHAGLDLDASRTMAAYDGKTVAAHVRAYEDPFGIVVAGVITPGLKPGDRQTLSRRKVSGDWRETPGGLSLVEVLALSPGPAQHAEPGFPVPGTFSVNGRQTALTAALGPDPGNLAVLRSPAPLVDVEALAAALERRQEERAVAAQARDGLTELVQARAADERAKLAELVSAGD